ncbi:hypothetical protein [Sabulibacter ruber]|uniref:hypothetical protein n=1 Tax=Sabulibacter ruber TaxID=2811901 RepID=UPI001A974861|nr:hypothetical protein [Sabulibacter ruber]
MTFKDWGETSEIYDKILAEALNKDLANESEAQTRFDIIDRIVRDVLQYQYGQVSVEEYTFGKKEGYVDYLLKCGDYIIIIEAKKIGSAFPTPTKRKKLKLTGSVLGTGEIKKAIIQAEQYAKEKNADAVVVTNGTCWCIYSRLEALHHDQIYATVLFPFDVVSDAEQLFNILSSPNVENKSLHSLTTISDINVINTLSNTFKDSNARVDRNKIADYISLALDNAINGESILNDEEKLRYCFVQTDARTKYDSTLEIYLSDKKPTVVLPARRIKKEKKDDELKRSIGAIESNSHQPVTLLIGGVGAGKSTYLSHFQKIHAKTLLKEKKCFWVYIDFEKLGNEEAKKFIYNSLLEFSLQEHEYVKTDYDNLIAPAYKEQFSNLARGPFAISARDPEKFNELSQSIILNDYNEVYPYVEKIYKHISKEHLCIIVMDNIDLYENDTLEISVLSEGIALSKKINSNIFISIRDTTFVKHKNDSIFNAYELRKFWIDAPPLREVLSKRLKFAGEILKGKKAELTLHNGFKLQVQDLSLFFDIAHSSLLQEVSARFIECVADGNIRKGINLVSNFLISGHIQVEKQIENYISNNSFNNIPFHEVFKGCVQGLWKYYIEDKAELINIINSGLNSKKLQFLRAYILNFLKLRGKDKSTLDTPVQTIIETFSELGAIENHIIKTLNALLKGKLIDADGVAEIDSTSIVHINLSGAYYYDFLLKRFEYIEAVLFDTPIFSDDAWDTIHSLSIHINFEGDSLKRMKFRKDRIVSFFTYIKSIEDEGILKTSLNSLNILSDIEKSINIQMDEIINKINFYSSKRRK